MKRYKTFFGAALLLFAGLAPRVSAAPGAVGQLLNVAGRVEIQRGKGPARRGTLLFPLQSGDVVKVAEGGVAQVVLFQNGAQDRRTAAARLRRMSYNASSFVLTW